MHSRMQYRLVRVVCALATWGVFIGVMALCGAIEQWEGVGI